MPETSASDWVIDVGDQDFAAAVVERSRTVPVVVDFWASWCAPCRALGPLLERLAGESAGAFVLARVDVDRNPAVAEAFGVRSIPMVLGFRDGQIAAEFVGALPEAAVREFLGRLLPSPGEQLARSATGLYEEGRRVEAEAAFRRALEIEPRCDEALLGLARLHADRDEREAALQLLERVMPGTALRQEADRLAAALRIQEGESADEEALRTRVAADPGDLEARFALAQSLAARSRHEEALEQYLAIVTRSREFRDDAARKAMLDIFEILGPGNETADRYRSELAKVLFR